MDRELDKVDEQLRLCTGSHLTIVENAIATHCAKIKHFAEDGSDGIQRLKTELRSDLEEIRHNHSEFCRQYVMVTHKIAEENNEAALRSTQDYQQEREEIKNIHLQDINYLRNYFKTILYIILRQSPSNLTLHHKQGLQLDARIEAVESRFEHEHLIYLNGTLERTVQFKLFANKDREFAREICLMGRKIERLQDTIDKSKMRVQRDAKESSLRNTGLSNQKILVANEIHHLKVSL